MNMVIQNKWIATKSKVSEIKVGDRLSYGTPDNFSFAFEVSEITEIEFSGRRRGRRFKFLPYGDSEFMGFAKPVCIVTDNPNYKTEGE